MGIKKSLFNAIAFYVLSNWVRLNLSALILILYHDLQSAIENNHIEELFRELAVFNIFVFSTYLFLDWLVFSLLSVIFNITIAYIVSFVAFWTIAFLFCYPFTSEYALETIIPCIIGYVAVAFCYWRTVKRWGL
jgi:hypothetical protein